MNLRRISCRPHRRWTAVSVSSLVATAGLMTALAGPASAADVTTQFTDGQTGFCLDSNYSDPAYPAVGAVYTDPCNGGAYQKWGITYGSGVVTLTDQQTGLCLDSNYSNPAYPAVGAVYTDACNGGAYQDWHVGTSSNGTIWFLQDAQTGLVLDSNYSNPAYPAVGAVYTDSCNGGSYQQWAYPAGWGFTLAIPAWPVGGSMPTVCPA